ncbi:MAG: DUF1849 family protein [Candidatus Paracaedibacteraceae bacterium]|nr:DUF1849 family protein [Candidatus Paracaedibacteraceae bacterium]
MKSRFLVNSLLLFALSTSFCNVCLSEQVPTNKSATTIQVAAHAEAIGAKAVSEKKQDSLFKPIPFYAKYKISLDKESHFDESINEVNGTLEITVEEKDDVWVVQQKSVLYIYYKGKEAADRYDLTIASWESKNGKRYEFYVRSIVNDEAVDEVIFKGDGEFIDGQQSCVNLKRIEFNQEEQKTIVLPRDTVFPLKHLHILVEEALKGNMVVGHKKVFDGSSDAQDIVEVDAYITPKNNYKMNINTAANSTTDPASIELAQRLENAKAWQIKMNVFALGSRDDSDPEYTYTQTVNSLGVPVSMKIKYPEPEFTVNIVMTDFSKAHLISGTPFDSKPTQ